MTASGTNCRLKLSRQLFQRVRQDWRTSSARQMISISPNTFRRLWETSRSCHRTTGQTRQHSEMKTTSEGELSTNLVQLMLTNGRDEADQQLQTGLPDLQV